MVIGVRTTMRNRTGVAMTTDRNKDSVRIITVTNTETHINNTLIEITGDHTSSESDVGSR